IPQQSNRNEAVECLHIPGYRCHYRLKPYGELYTTQAFAVAVGSIFKSTERGVVLLL
ncbi:hypothetical protein B296_00019930, partial [Ensete ventricosum]